MCKFVSQFGYVVVFKAKTKVKFTIKPNSGRTILFNNNPLPDIEFPAIYN